MVRSTTKNTYTFATSEGSDACAMDLQDEFHVATDRQHSRILTQVCGSAVGRSRHCSIAYRVWFHITARLHMVADDMAGCDIASFGGQRHYEELQSRIQSSVEIKRIEIRTEQNYLQQTDTMHITTSQHHNITVKES